MGTYIAKLKNDNEHWFKIKDNVQNDDYQEIDLNDALPFDPNNMMADQWFKLEDFNENESFLPMLALPLDCATLESINRERYGNIEIIAFLEDNRFYIQKVLKGSFLRKKWFAPFGDLVEYKETEGVLYVNPLPNCIYDKRNHNLYFMSISKAYAVFNGLRSDYREATAAEINEFLNSDIVETIDFDQSKVGLSNRKRITSILNIYKGYNADEKQILKEYIHEKIGEALTYTDEGKFTIRTDTQLRLLLLGVQRRFYIPPLQDEVQVATNTTKLSNLL